MRFSKLLYVASLVFFILYTVSVGDAGVMLGVGLSCLAGGHAVAGSYLDRGL